MNSIQSSFNHHSFLFWAVLLILVVAVSTWTLALQTRTARLEHRIEDLLGAAEADNIGRMLIEYLGTVRTVASAVEHLKSEHERIARLMPSTVRHVGLIRFSPFHDTGGDQSFTLAILDGRRNGVVVTGLHSRTDSRLYAKPVFAGDSEYTLIPEEREAIAQAITSPQAAPVS